MSDTQHKLGKKPSHIETEHSIRDEVQTSTIEGHFIVRVN